MTLKEKLIIYVYHKTNQMEQDKEILNANRRKGTFDSLDMYELMRSDIRIQCWDEFLRDFYSIIFNCK